jgi:CDP-diacylglycerol--serine O-phosphatidyltransferase
MSSDRLSAMKQRMRRLKTLPVLPTLLTAGNLACGITAILCAAHNLLFAGAVMVFVAMFCDMLDGKVARLTKTDGPFGAELDSLSDVVSFGVAPAILVHRLVLGTSGVFDHGQRLLWFITVFYPVMAAIRLARYNVEHSDEATPYFRGIPSPGAAAVVCSWIIFQTNLTGQGILESPQIGATYSYTGLENLDAVRWAILGLTVLSALLMVSTVRYPHVGNTLLGRLGFRKLIVLMFLGVFLVWQPWYTLLIGTTGYLIWGLLGEIAAMRQRLRRGKPVLEDEDEDEEEIEDAGLGGERHIHEGPATGR